MRKLHEEIQQHIHDKLCAEVNETIIALKLHSEDVARESTEQQNKIIAARENHPDPHRDQLIDLLTRVRDEMNECKQPYRRY